MNLKTNQLKLLLSILLLIGVQACSTTTGQYSNGHDMDIKITPYRSLKVLVATDGTYDRETIEQHISRTSRVFEDQFGIRLEPVKYVPIAWGNWGDRDVGKMLYKLYSTAKEHDFDISIGYAKMTAGEAVTRYLIGGWDGVIDDTWRRFIIVKNLDDHTILHELCHAFVFSEDHSGLGLMSAATIQLLPFIPISLASNRMDDHLRSEVLRNKWRDFAKVVALPERMDPIVAQADVRTGS
ncbi:MAG: hypothetical protein L7F78_13245 [Syntrophales bacterium LBB04]|nr:hypothetical protein [Syntrophales bacterium LBB04]